MTFPQFINYQKTLKVIAYTGIASFILIIFIKGIIRPINSGFSKSVTLLQGVLPNFFAATGLSAFSFIYTVYSLFKRKSNKVILKAVIVSLLFSLFVLFTWEYLQFFIWQYPADVLDLISSVIGSVIMEVFIILITIKIRRNENEIIEAMF